MFWGYNTNGWLHHRWSDAVEILADLGYQGIGLTLDHSCLDPYSATYATERSRASKLLGRLRMRSAIETGARFILDPRRKHQPTLLSARADERERRVDFLSRSIDLAAELGSEAISFWSGAPDDQATRETHLDRLCAAMEPVLRRAEDRQVRLALEPEPDMFLATVAQANVLLDRLHHPLLGLAIDVGHCHCAREENIPGIIVNAGTRVTIIHIEDMRAGIHEHLMFGEGEMDFPPILQSLKDIDFKGGVYVELSGHSATAVDSATRAIRFLSEYSRSVDRPDSART